MRVSEVYDIEIFVNTFIYCSYVIEEDKWYTFIIHNDIDQSEELFNHLTREGFYHIGFNNSKFDYIIIHQFLTNYRKYQYESGFSTAHDLYFKAKQLIESDDNFEFIKNPRILQIDLMSIYHLGYKSKRTSLKDIEFFLNMDIKESSIPFDTYVEYDQLDEVIKYCKHDVLATYNFYKLSRGLTDNPVYKGIDELKLRSNIKKEFRINCLNYPNVKIGEQLILSLYCKKTGKKWSEVKEMQTDRSHVDLDECIPSFCRFNSKPLNDVLNLIKTKTIDTSVMNFEHELIYHGIKLTMGCGGLHGSIKSGIYKSDDENVILSLDINSMYPSIAKVCKLYPEHLGPVFNDVYIPFVDKRLEEKKKKIQDLTLVKAFKLITNCVFGKSNEKKSFLLDQKYFLSTTFTGQLFTLMWMEKVVEACPEVQFLLVNTDGIEILIPRHSEEKVIEACELIEREIGLTIGSNVYKKLVINNVNEYIAEYSDSTKDKEHIKLNGRFAIYKEIHKDPSAKIIAIALKEYFINNIPVSQTIKNHKNIFDFCIRLKVNRSSKAKYSYFENGFLKFKELGKTTRYFCSNDGGSLSVFYNNSETPNRISKDFTFTLFNEYYDSDNYNINYQYYITEANKIKDVIEDMQLSLF
jgi:hypothetical protein